MTGATLAVVSPGAFTTVQELPGRLGRWEVGVPPSGPMDELSMRIGNRLVGNPHTASALEVTVTGPRLRFPSGATVAVTGAPLAVEVDGIPVPQWALVSVPAGGTLKLGVIRGVGMRAYVCVRGALDTTVALGSRAGFALAHLGQPPLRKGDQLTIGDEPLTPPSDGSGQAPAMANDWVLRVVCGPHGAPDFLTAEGAAELFTSSWTVHHHSDRTGIRLEGPQPAWARADGGDAGLHPSNILDSAYGVGTVMLAGDMAVIVGPDGPSLGGFVAAAQVIRADRWKLGQVRAGDRVRLEPVDPESAARARLAFDQAVAGVTAAMPTTPATPESPTTPASPATLAGPATPALPEPPKPLGQLRLPAPVQSSHGEVTYRRAGEDGLLIEFGAPLLELRSRVRAHALQQALVEADVRGVIDITPGVRSLLVHHDPDVLPTARLLDAAARLEAELDDPEELVIPSRVVHLPLAWRHSQAMLAVERYASSVRDDAPWCPDNIEFIRRINGLPDEAAVRAIVADAAYLVLGLGDVYLGAPVAVPLDPRHRLVTTKYNPVRTWTPENAVGIGGAFLCVYGMEGPGGYQLVGRTVQVWRERDERPWLLDHFDQLRFHYVSEERLEHLRSQRAEGTWMPDIEPTSFSLTAHAATSSEHSTGIAAFRATREEAFHAERLAWSAVESA